MNERISVIMGIYNCETTLAQAIDSIINQTYENWVLIMCDDCSTDGTYALAESYLEHYPQKIILFRNEKNMGLNFTLNKCLEKADGYYVARMDGDDISCPERFERQLACFSQNPEIAIVSSKMIYFDSDGEWGQCSVIEKPQKKDFINSTPFCHAPSMVKREAYEKVGGYTVSERLLRVEDYHLWVKMYSAGYTGMNIPQALYKMRDDRDAFNRRKFRYRINELYVRMLAVKQLDLPKYGYIYALRPIAVGLLSASVYKYLHRKRLK